MDLKKEYKYSVFKLKIIKFLSKIKTCFIPLSFHLIMILKQTDRKTVPMNKPINSKKVKIDSKVAESDELKEYVIDESITLLGIHLNTFSNTVGFPEVVSILKDELKNFTGNETIDEFMKLLTSHSKYLIKNRKDIDSINKESMVEFECSVKKLLE